VKRPPFDLNLWLVCSGGLLVLVLIGLVVDPPQSRPLWFDLGVAPLGCLIIGWAVQHGLVKGGYRLTRRSDAEAEDYEDKS
jgi:hypothetical protein